MPEIKLFIATSLDGFIARENNSLDWLDEIANQDDLPESEKHDGGYYAFFSEIDVIVIGRKTYEEVLGFGVEWPYAGCKTFVITSDKNYKTQTVDSFVINEISRQSIEEIKAASQKNVWLVGGGMLITEFLNRGAIDEMTLNLASIILGKGIRLFPDEPAETKFDLTATQVFGSKMVNLTYRKKAANA